MNVTKIGFLSVHGIGEQNGDFAEASNREIFNFTKEQIKVLSQGKLDLLPENFVCMSVWWAPLASERQSEFYNKCLMSGMIANDHAHSFFCKYVTDLISYYNSKDDGRQKLKDPRTDFYQHVQDLFDFQMEDMRKRVGTGPISILAHSLGTIMTAHYLKYRNKEAINNLFFIGSPVAAANAGYHDFGDPGFQLAPNGQFLNFVEKNDCIAYPLRGTLNEKWDKLVTKDISVNVGGLLTCWNPLSHTDYWTDNDVTKVIAEILAKQYVELNGGSK